MSGHFFGLGPSNRYSSSYSDPIRPIIAGVAALAPRAIGDWAHSAYSTYVSPLVRSRFGQSFLSGAGYHSANRVFGPSYTPYVAPSRAVYRLSGYSSGYNRRKYFRGNRRYSRNRRYRYKSYY